MGFLIKAGNFKAATDIYDPTTMEKRREIAGQCQESLQYGVRTYVDGMDDAVSKAYAAMPTRLYLVGPDDRVLYASGLGPAGFKPAKFKNAIGEYLATVRKQSPG